MNTQVMNKPSANGTAHVQAAPTTKPLSAAQRRHIERLVAQIAEADRAIKTAEDLRNAVQANANGYLGYLAEEHEAIAKDGWRFDQETMAFVLSEEKEE